MDDVIERVRKHAENLANNGAPHQTGVGRDILQVVSVAASHIASVAVTNAAAITAASGAKALQDELSRVGGQLAEVLEENTRLTQDLSEAVAENATLRAELDVARYASDPSGLGSRKADGVALTSASHEQFGISIDEVVGKMQAGGIMGPNGEVMKAKTDKREKA